MDDKDLIVQVAFQKTPDGQSEVILYSLVDGNVLRHIVPMADEVWEAVRDMAIKEWRKAPTSRLRADDRTMLRGARS